MIQKLYCSNALILCDVDGESAHQISILASSIYYSYSWNCQSMMLWSGDFFGLEFILHSMLTIMRCVGCRFTSWYSLHLKEVALVIAFLMQHWGDAQVLQSNAEIESAFSQDKLKDWISTQLEMLKSWWMLVTCQLCR